MATDIKVIHMSNTSGGYNNTTVKSATDNVTPLVVATRKYIITSTLLEACNSDYSPVTFKAEVWNDRLSEWKDVYYLHITHERATMSVDDFVSKHTKEIEDIMLAILF